MGVLQTLQRLEGHPFRLEHSDGLEGRAREIAEVVGAGYGVLSHALGFSPTLRLLVLSRADWPSYAANPTYGFPHCSDGQTLIVAPEPPEFWEGIRGWAFGPVSEAQMASLEAVYGRHHGEIDVRPFNDLVVLHELGHIFHRQVPFDFPRFWLRELFATLCQYAAVAVAMPERLPHLMALPEATHRDARQVSLRKLEDFQPELFQAAVGNFIWFQWQILFAARAIFEAEGLGALRRCFDTSLHHCDRSLAADDLVDWLCRKYGERIANIPRNWPSVR
jgi:hypothetical protein